MIKPASGTNTVFVSVPFAGAIRAGIFMFVGTKSTFDITHMVILQSGHIIILTGVLMDKPQRKEKLFIISKYLLSICTNVLSKLTYSHADCFVLKTPGSNNTDHR